MELLTNEEEKFCCDFVRGDKPTEAYRKNFPNTEKDSYHAMLMMKKRKILSRIVDMRDAAARAAVMDGSKVIDEWTKIAMCDVNELVQYQRVNCRHCHGAEGEYHWKDEEEFGHALAVAIDAGKKELPHDKGGYGFQFNGEINNDCLECFGEGVERLFLPDTRYLSPAAKSLYAGAKRTRDGIEIITRDKDAALLNLAKYFKLLAPEQKGSDSGEGYEININGGLPE